MPYSSSQAFLHTAAAAQTASDTAYVYDGWNLVAEYTIVDNGASVDRLQAYTWGLDLSGSMQGAGGFGGLLCIHRLPDLDDGSRIWGDKFYLTYDGNGKISKYLYDNGDEESRFEYDPSRKVVAPTDSWDNFTYRFSTKPQDDETGLYYYGYRYYDPVIGRWPSRDPIEERGGVNLYGFVGNSGINFVDVLGKRTWGIFVGGLSVLCCKKCPDLLEKYRYIPDDGSKSLTKIPIASDSVHLTADALYLPGIAYKIGDNGALQLTCDCEEKTVTLFKLIHGLGINEWKYGEPDPPKGVNWPGGDEAPDPYETDPPGK